MAIICSSWNSLFAEAKKWGVVTGSASTATKDRDQITQELSAKAQTPVEVSENVPVSPFTKKFQRSPLTA
jgi:hypothetical protein